MRRRVVRFLALLLAAVVGLSLWSSLHAGGEEDRGPERLDIRYPPLALRGDIEFLVRSIREVHPDLPEDPDFQGLERLAREVVTHLDRPMTRIEFYPHAARLAASLRDGHTAVPFPREELEQAMGSDERWFPFDLKAIGEGPPLVIRSYLPSCPIQPGDRILSLDGVSMDEWIRRFLETTSGEKPFYRRGRVLRSFALNLWVAGNRSPYRIGWQSRETGEEQALEVAGTVWRARSRHSEGPRKAFTFTRLDGEVGYLDFREMVGLSAFEDFLHRVFTGIRERPIRGLIIDLRANGGGATRLGELLLSYITDRPYRMAAGAEVKVSRQLKRAWKAQVPSWLRWFPLQDFYSDWRRVWRTPEGESAVLEFPLRPPAENPLRFRGPVCVLIGERTFSSAQKLANAIRDGHLATLIGSETGGNPNACGDLVSMRLPATRLEFVLSTKRYVRANGDRSWRRGILPDIEVRNTVDDFRSGRDAVLEYARQWVLAGGPAPAAAPPAATPGPRTGSTPQ